MPLVAAVRREAERLPTRGRARSRSSGSGSSSSRSSSASASTRRVAARPDRASVRERCRHAGHPAHDALLRGQPRRPVRDDARVRARALRAPGRRVARAHAARARRLARPARVAEPDVGEPRRPQPAVLAVLLPAAAGAFPEALGGVDAETGTARSTRCEPSLIRVEADEATYNLHIILRFELEQEMLAGDDRARGPAGGVEPSACASTSASRCPNDAHGVLQDMHWASGALGYFPTYALGNVDLGADLGARRRRRARPHEQLRAGRVRRAARVAARAALAAHGRKFTPRRRCVERIVGGRTRLRSRTCATCSGRVRSGAWRRF